MNPLECATPLTTLREEIEKFAHVIFAGGPKQRDYWLGLGVLSADDIAGYTTDSNPVFTVYHWFSYDLRGKAAVL